MYGGLTFLMLLGIGLIAGLGYDIFAADVGLAPVPAGQTVAGPALEFGSYMSGLVVGMLLATIAHLPWRQMPVRIQKFIVSKKRIYKYSAVACCCIAVLFYL